MNRILLFLSPFLFLACKTENPQQDESDQLGVLHESFSVSEAAKADFEHGLLLLHNFEYDDARTAFREAQALDPDAVMCYWGEAMTFNHPLWRRQEFEDGAAALDKLGADEAARSAKAASEIERGFLQGAEILFGSGEKDERDQAYNAHMKAMYDQFPENEEVAAFYALSILGAVPVGRDVAAYESGAEVAKSVLANNPRHPGALHYLIHSYDDPAHAHLALDAAANYSQVAADAVHALHMPSHIFLAVGMWEEVVSSNIASFDASVKRKEEKDLDNDALSYHALSWLQYGYMQLGKFEEAEKIMDDMLAYTETLPSQSARGYCIAMKGAYLLGTSNWDHPVAQYQIDTDELGITARSKIRFIDGIQAYKGKNAELMSELISALEEDLNQSALLVDESGLPMCSSGSGSSYKINQLDLEQSKVVLYELKALSALLAENSNLAEEWFKKATDLETQLSYGFGPPVILKPSHEMYGEWLLDQGRIEEARTEFEKALERSPNRRLSVLGLEQTKAVEEI